MLTSRGGMNMNSKQLTLFLLIFSILTMLSIPFAALVPSAEEEALYDSVIRLHVLANSDSDTDQALKLKVRDSILSAAADAVEGCKDFDSALSSLGAALDELRAAAEKTVRSEGYDYPVEVTLTTESYPTREYRGVSLPAGEYTSLRVLIGEAGGHNWWCVAFPTLCLPATSEGFQEVSAEAGLSGTLEKTLAGEEGYEIRFFLLDQLGKLENHFFEP